MKQFTYDPMGVTPQCYFTKAFRDLIWYELEKKQLYE